MRDEEPEPTEHEVEKGVTHSSSTLLLRQTTRTAEAGHQKSHCLATFWQLMLRSVEFQRVHVENRWLMTDFGGLRLDGKFHEVIFLTSI
jgi:hypothetical protein